MDDLPQPPKPPTVDNSEPASQNDAKALSQVVGSMKQKIEEEAKRLTSPAPMGKPQGMTQACSVMKEEIYDRSPEIDDERPLEEENVELSPAEREHKKL